MGPVPQSSGRCHILCSSKAMKVKRYVANTFSYLVRPKSTRLCRWRMVKGNMGACQHMILLQMREDIWIPNTSLILQKVTVLDLLIYLFSTHVDTAILYGNMYHLDTTWVWKWGIQTGHTCYDRIWKMMIHHAITCYHIYGHRYKTWGLPTKMA
jgi:hypothetical protein